MDFKTMYMIYRDTRQIRKELLFEDGIEDLDKEYFNKRERFANLTVDDIDAIIIDMKERAIQERNKELEILMVFVDLVETWVREEFNIEYLEKKYFHKPWYKKLWLKKRRSLMK